MDNTASSTTAAATPANPAPAQTGPTDAQKAIDAADDATFGAIAGAAEPDAPAAPATAEAKPAAAPAAKAAATAEADQTADEVDPLEGLAIPGTKGKPAATATAEDDRLAVARGRLYLTQEGFTEDEIEAMKPERVMSLGKRALAGEATDPPGQATAAAAAQTEQAKPLTLAKLDALLGKDTLSDDADKAAIRAAVQDDVAAFVQAQVREQVAAQAKALQEAEARESAAADGYLRMRFDVALKPLMGEMPALKERATLAKVVAVMEKLDPDGSIATGVDPAAFSSLLKQSALVVLGDSIATTARRSQINKSRAQAAAVPEAPIGGANAAGATLSQGDLDDRLIDAISAGTLPEGGSIAVPKK